jgi:hypothetical protein
MSMVVAATIGLIKFTLRDAGLFYSLFFKGILQSKLEDN